VAFEGAAGLAGGAPGLLPAGEVGQGGRVDAGLDEGDHVEEPVQLPVPAPVAAVPDAPRGGGLQGRDTGHGGDLRLLEPAPGRVQLGDEAGGGERPDALDGLQRGEPRRDEGLERPAQMAGFADADEASPGGGGWLTVCRV
jgi:hypothetical protein